MDIMKYIIIILFIIGCNFIELQAKTTKYSEKDITKVSNIINSKFSDKNNINRDFWLLSNNLELESNMIINGNLDDYNQFNTLLNNLIIDVNKECKSIIINDIKSSYFVRLFNNVEVRNKLLNIINDKINNSNVNDLFLNKIIAKQATTLNKPLGIKGEEVLDPLMSKMKAAGAKSMTVELDEDASNQAEIDAVNQQNEDMIMRAEEQYGNQTQEYESLKQRAQQVNRVRDIQRNLDREAGLSSGSASRSAGSGAYLDLKPGGRQPKMPVFMQPKLTPVPKPTTSKLSDTMQTPQNTGGSKPDSNSYNLFGNEVNNYIYNTIINHYLILLGK
jgi:hypothetical protein